MEDNFVKITNAVYKVLEFFPDGDPLKNKAKEKALSILEKLTLIFNSQGWISLKTYLSPEREKNILQVMEDIEVLENYLKVAKYQGWIDDVNFLIIIKEYNKIKEEVNNKKGRIRQDLRVASNIENNTANKELVVRDNQYHNSEEHSISTGRQAERQKKILQILTEKGRAQVSDIIKELPNITKRTVRRDLDGLLKKGKIVRMGEFSQVFYQTAKAG